ncbi:MAG: type II secretion system F family protein [Acidimicrobiales bacterium]
MISLVLAAMAAIGVFWLYTAVALGWEGFGFGPAPTGSRPDRRRVDLDAWLAQAGLEGVDTREFTGVVLMLFTLSTVLAYAAFGGPVPALAIGAFAASFPVASYRVRRQLRRQRAQEAWPRMIEEIRVQTASLGRSIPQALFDVGRRGPDELRPAFEAAHREWLLTTDLSLTLAVLKDRLADPTADMACETLLVAHELGGTDLDRRLEALAEDRLQDVRGRKDARSRQAGARFARVFVLLVPAGMALAGMSIGEGRVAYRSAGGQATVLVALALVIACWVWAGRVMRLPEQERVFS